MIYKIFLTGICFASSILFSQLIHNVETYDNGNIKYITYHQRVGDKIIKVKYEEFYNNGNKRQEGAFKNNEKSGVWKEWNEKGIKISEGNYNRGLRDGFWIGWNDNGSKQGEVTWQNGKEDGLWIIWHQMVLCIKQELFQETHLQWRLVTH